MSKVKKAVEKAMEILRENGVHHTLVCEVEGDRAIVSIQCTPDELLSSFCYLAEELKNNAEQEGFPKILIAKELMDAVEMAVFDTNEIEGED